MPIARVHRQHRPNANNPDRVQFARSLGFTLIELMVTLAVFAILMSLAVPSFVRMVAADRMSTQTNELVMGLNTAKSEAIRRGQSVTLRSKDNVGLINFNKGWLTFTDGDSDGAAASPATDIDGTIVRDTAALAGTTTVVRATRSGTSPSFTYPAATSALNGRQFITFNARGGTTAGGSAFFRICDSANPSIPGRIVQVSMVGRVSLDSTTENCSS